MSLPVDPAANLATLIRCPSVTPAEGGALSALEAMLKPMGFTVERPVFTEDGTPDVENLHARLGDGGRHLMFAGHTDVVPPGDEGAWSHPPFAADVANGRMYGRGAVDMKGGIACFVAAVARHVEDRGRPAGSVSLLITGDEEGPSINGSVKLLDWAARRGEHWDGAIVGEPTNPAALGDMIKVGRRGSVTGDIVVHGRQGHAAYPHLADNPVRGLMSLLDALLRPALDGARPTSSRPISRSPRSMSAIRRPTSFPPPRGRPSTSASRTPGRPRRFRPRYTTASTRPPGAGPTGAGARSASRSTWSGVTGRARSS